MLKNNSKKFIFLLKISFPIIMTLFSLYLPIFSNTDSFAILGIVSIPFTGFLIIACLSILGKLQPIVANFCCAAWLICCLPITWYVAIIVDKFFPLGIELYL